MVVVRMGKMQDIRYGGMMGRTSVIFQAGGEVRGGEPNDRCVEQISSQHAGREGNCVPGPGEDNSTFAR
jgi:hypothetical protein